MKIGVIGSGYVGLVAGACFAESGNTVWCVDIDKSKIQKLQDGIIPIFEPGLEELVKKNVAKERLFFTTDLKPVVEQCSVFFIAVGTPQGEDGSADLQYVISAAKNIATHMNGYKVIVNKSTVPVGTAQKVRKAVAEITTQPFDVVSNPEFLKEGAAIDDFMKPDRVVIGSDSAKATEIMKQLYAPFVRTGKPIFVMGVQSAEVTKYASNALLATKVTFMNEMANFCEKVGADVNEVRVGVGSDARIGNSFLFPGVGYGGSCFPKDVKALIYSGEEAGLEMSIVNAVDRANNFQKTRLVSKVKEHFGDVTGKRFAMWGLAFKPQTDDMREAPSLVVINALTAAGATVVAYDPEALESAKLAVGDNKDVSFVGSAYKALDGADALLVVTEWNEFRSPDFSRMYASLKEKVIFDGRNIFDPAEVRQLGFTYYGIGRK